MDFGSLNFDPLADLACQVVVLELPLVHSPSNSQPTPLSPIGGGVGGAKPQHGEEGLGKGNRREGRARGRAGLGRWSGEGNGGKGTEKGGWARPG